MRSLIGPSAGSNATSFVMPAAMMRPAFRRICRAIVRRKTAGAEFAYRMQRECGPLVQSGVTQK